MIDLSRPYDVLVMGGGNAGLCAAISARQNGASVLLLEHAPEGLRGGDSRHARNLRVMEHAPTSRRGHCYRESEFAADLFRATDGCTDEKLARITIRDSAALKMWMESCGVRFQDLRGKTAALSHKTLYFLGGGKAMLNAYYHAAQRLGVDILYDVEVLSIRMRDGFAREVKVAIQGRSAQVHARAMVASSGGFHANTEWLRLHWGDAVDNFIIRGSPYSNGRLLKDLLDQGATPVGGLRRCHIVAVDGRSPRFDGGIVTRLACMPFSVVVDRSGRRFHDEGAEIGQKRYAVWGRLVAERPGQIAYSIFDSKVEHLFAPSLFPPIRAQSMMELAVKLGLDPYSLDATIRDYNGAVRFGARIGGFEDRRTSGVAPPKTRLALPIDTPPFNGHPLKPGVTFSHFGLKVDAAAHVVMTDGRPSPNLFAAGLIMSANIIGQGYLAGLGMTIGAVFGRIAGREASKAARERCGLGRMPKKAR